MRIARDSGDVSSIFPPGVTSLRDLPWTLHRAISLGLAFLKFEELPKDEQPSREIWFNRERMDAHWEAVEKRRDEKYGPSGQNDDESDWQRNAALDDLYVK